MKHVGNERRTKEEVRAIKEKAQEYFILSKGKGSCRLPSPDLCPLLSSEDWAGSVSVMWLCPWRSDFM